MCGLTKPRRTRTIRSEGVETTVTAPARGLTTTAHLAPTTVTFSGSAGIERRFSTRPSGSEIARSAFCVSAVTSATGLPPPRAEPPPSATTARTTTASLRATEGYERPSREGPRHGQAADLRGDADPRSAGGGLGEDADADGARALGRALHVDRAAPRRPLPLRDAHRLRPRGRGV